MKSSRAVELYVHSLCELAKVWERLSHAHEVQCPSCGARWPASRMQSAGTVYGDGKRTVTFCLHSCSTMRWTRPVLDVVLERFGVLSEDNMDIVAMEEVD